MSTLEVASPSPTSARSQRPELTSAQKTTLADAAGEVVRATCLGLASSLKDPQLAGCANRVVSGVFVSLKRGKHLRGCCGMLGQPTTLGLALHEAAVRTTLEDLRFPPVSASDLAHLRLEVWILYNPEPMTAKGEDREKAVIVGKHGLQIVRGQNRGLLLPGVATDHGWDARKFLEQVCVKAGLHPSLWKDEDTALYTFEGEVVHGQVPAAGVSPTPFLTPEQLSAYASFFRGNIAALLMGATPNYYLMGVPDGHVAGIIGTIRRSPHDEAMQFASPISLRPGIPLQSSLFALAQPAAQALANQRINEADFAAAHFGITILTEPTMHGTVADADLGGLDSAKQALLVLERQKAGLAFDPKCTAEELLAEAAGEAQVGHPHAAAVFGLGVISTETSVRLSTAPRPIRGPAQRPPAVAGTFYPADAAELSSYVEELIGAPGRAESWPAAMVPHAGLRYSGQIAAGVLKRLQYPSTIIVIGPKHTPLGVEWAVAPQQSWMLPGGNVESDFILARQLCESIPGLQLDAQAHQREHAIEVELPFLAKLAPHAKVVGIAVGNGDLEGCKRFAEGLATVIRHRKEKPLLLISSDMNHFATDAETRRLDEMALEAMERLDPEALYETVTENHISMCGLMPAVIVMETLRLLGKLTRAERCGYATTADATHDPSRVVGYAGMLLA